MGRPRGFDRDVALDKAMLLFWEHGFEQTSLRDLTRELGISSPSLYAAFGDKRTLFNEAVARYEAAPESVTTTGLRAASQQEVLKRMFDAAAREYTSAEHPHGCLVNSEPTLTDSRTHNRAITTARLREVSDGSEAGGDPEAVAAFAHAVLVGLSSYARDGAREEQLRRVADIAMRAVTGQEMRRFRLGT